MVAGGLAVLVLGWLFTHMRAGAALVADYLTQKVVVSGTSACLSLACLVPITIAHTTCVRRSVHTSVEVSQREEAWDWILQWLAEQPKSSFASHNYRHSHPTSSGVHALHALALC
jgi:hypothetical protein